MKRGKTVKEKETIDEDLTFLRDMMTDRKYKYTSKDLITSKSVKHRYIRVQSEDKRLLKEESRMAADETVCLECDEEDVIDQDAASQTNFETPERTNAL